jgi:hypothetical protein
MTYPRTHPQNVTQQFFDDDDYAPSRKFANALKIFFVPCWHSSGFSPSIWLFKIFVVVLSPPSDMVLPPHMENIAQVVVATTLIPHK